MKVNNGDYPESSTSTLGFKSQMRDDHLKTFQTHADKQISVLNSIFRNDDSDYRDDNGQKLLNTNKDKVWFSKNVAFIFGVGSIKDEEDDAFLAAVLGYFNNTNESGFLMNHYRVLDYTSPLIVELENKMKISSGNYHVFMVPVVYADENELMNAPEAQFRRKGPVKKFMKWQQITDYMRGIMSKYGLVTELKREVNTKTIGHDKKLKRNEGFKVNDDVNEITQDLISYDLEMKDELRDGYNNRVKVNKSTRDAVPNEKSMTGKRKTLYKQMNEDKRILLPMELGDTHHVHGVELRGFERHPSREQDTPEYQIYDDNSTYVNNKNLHGDDIVESRPSVPSFNRTTKHNDNYFQDISEGIAVRNVQHNLRVGGNGLGGIRNVNQRFG